ncbi:hypothetical protein FRZ44_38310 [Hypericibacter terrae]|uniref:Uncharacterized protein n=1 Tax=Hypericibacter terrae TaxID=2602015 RepID=A0A5J6MM45_9PROT|nr:hypothetical protein [Hypericibacter terrae]QEX18524.1 hypothetical protein FRZ44_38310 [Hypericibacter terrae]
MTCAQEFRDLDLEGKPLDSFGCKPMPLASETMRRRARDHELALLLAVIAGTDETEHGAWCGEGLA